MQASNILTSVAILFIALAVWQDMRKGNRVTSAGKTHLLIAAIFAFVNIANSLFGMM